VNATEVIEAPAKTRLLGQRVRRVEDWRYVTGQASYLGNIHIPGMLHAAFARSDLAHGAVRAIDLTAAREVPGVVDAVSGTDIRAHCRPIRADTSEEQWQGSEQWPLAVERVRFVGEPVAAVVAASRYEAEDGVDLVLADIEPLPVVASIDEALEPAGPKLHDGWRDNCFVKCVVEGGDVYRAFAQAPRELEVTCANAR
jgi:carbon-monoxide dehydrogenase large subunit